MHRAARVLGRLPWLVWVCLLLAAPATAAASAVTAITDAHHTRAAVTPVPQYCLDDGPANDADTGDPAGPPPLALAVAAPTPVPARLSARVPCTVARPHSFRLLGPLGSRPPPASS